MPAATMAQRLAVLLAVASILIIACAADEPAAAYKYEKKSHSKHSEKYDKPEHKEYKPDGYKPDGYKPDGYKPDGYKPDGYKPDGQKPDYHKPGYGGKEYEYYGEHTYAGKPYDPVYGPAPYGGGNPYDHAYGPAPYNGYAPGYNAPHEYDSGYYGGADGRQIIHLQSIWRENLINDTLIDDIPGQEDGGRRCRRTNSGRPRGCDRDLGLICGLTSPYGSYSDEYGESYGSGKTYPLLPRTPTEPAAIGKGFYEGNIDLDQDFPGGIVNEDDVRGIYHLGKQRWAYRVGRISGYLEFVNGADTCHPLLGSGTIVNFGNNGARRIPVFAMFTKTKAPGDPAWAWRLWNKIRNSGNPFTLLPFGRAASIQSAEKEPAYKTTSDGTKYVAGPGYAYVAQEDGSYCGLTLVVKGPCTMSVTVDGTTTNYGGVIESPILFWDGVMRLPGISDRPNDGNNPRQVPSDFPTEFNDEESAVFYGLTVQRLAAMCKSNDIPFADIGEWTIDVTPSAA